MKLSLKFEGDDEKHEHSTQIMTAKVPIAILNKPFTSGVTATTGTDSPSEFSFSLSTNFSSGPSLRLSYSPTASLPFSLSLKSGLGLLGHPAHSPLVFSANLSLSPTQSPLPSFFLHFKPQFGHFSLHKTVFSDSNTQSISLPPPTPSPQIETSFVADESSSGWHNLKLEPLANQVENSVVVNKNDAKFGVRVMARTVMPVARGFYLNFRWGVNFPRNFGSRMPSLTVNKIRLERVEEGKENSENNNKQRRESSESDLNLLKGMCFLMGRDLKNMERENREIKRVLDEVKMGVSTARNHREENNGGGRKFGESSGEFQRWRSNRNGRQEDEKKVEPNKSQQSVVSDVESELQKAIKAATS